MDISNANGESSVDSQYWLLVIDEATEFQWSFFLSAKKQTKNKIPELVTDLKASNNVAVKNSRCDNAGENRDTDNY